MKKQFLFILLLGLLIPSSGVITLAQCKQKGVVLEYNRSQKKKPYSLPVQLQFNTVSQINNEKGQFVLEFLKEKPGDLVNNYKVEPSDSKYILFNGAEINNWTLTPQKELKIELCKKELIDYLVKTYTQNEMARIKREYDIALQELKEKNGKIEDFRKLESIYQNQIDELKTKVIEFAYIDETTLDSLQLLWRDYILANNYDAAAKVLQQMNLQESTAKRAEIIKKTSDMSFAEVQELEQDCDFLRERIQSYKRQGRNWCVIKPDYVSLIESYNTLLDTYQNRLRCSAEYLNSLCDKAGKAMFDFADTLAWINYDSCMYWLKEAARLDNVPACYELGNKTKDYQESLNWYKKALEIATSQGKTIWSGHNKRLFTVDDIRTDIESFPDFYYIHESDSLFFHILDSKRVSLVYFRHSSDNNVIKIPQYVKYQGKKYIVSKIGTGAINNISYGGMQKTDGPWCTFSYSHDDKRNKIEQVYLPNTIDTICINSIHNMANVPNKLRHLGSWNGFSNKLKTIQLPSNMTFLGDISFDKDQTLFIPPSLQEIGETTSAGKVVIVDSNPHFTTINGALYSADKKKVWIGTVDSLLYIPRELKVDDGRWFGVGYVAEHIKDFKLENDSQYYSEYDGTLYSHNYDSLLFMTKKHPSTLKLHPNTKVLANSHHLSSSYGIKELIVPSIENIDAIYDLLNAYSKSYNSYNNLTLRLWGDSIVLYSKEFEKVISQAELLCKKHEGDNSFLYFYGLLNVINNDIEEARRSYSQMLQQSELAKKLVNHIEKMEETKNDAISYGLESYHQLQKEWNNITDKEKQVRREEILNCLGPAVPYLTKELNRHPNETSIYNIIGLFYSLQDNYPYIKKKAYETMDRIKDLDPDYASKGYELYDDLLLSK